MNEIVIFDNTVESFHVRVFVDAAAHTDTDAFLFHKSCISMAGVLCAFVRMMNKCIILCYAVVSHSLSQDTKAVFSFQRTGKTVSYYFPAVQI